MIALKAARVSSGPVLARGFFGAVAQPRQRRLEIMRYIVRHLAKPVINSPMRASIALRFSARRSSSSPAPVVSSL